MSGRARTRVHRLDSSSPLAPDERWGVDDAAGEPVAAASLWWRRVPALPGSARVGVVGEYQAESDAAARMLLDVCCGRLAEEGCTVAVGPMDRDTWHRYRFVTWSSGAPPFAFEPENPAAFPRQWLDSGFTAMAGYCSVEVPDLTRSDPRLEQHERRLEGDGIRIRQVDLGELTTELRSAYRITHAAFADALLFTPVTESEFLAQHLPTSTLLRPELTLIAEDADGPVAFLLAFPDPRRPPPSDTVVVKTVAVLPNRRHAGLGAVLFQRTLHEAHRLGMSRGVAALMRDSNYSTVTALGFGPVMRRYTLYARRLETR